MLAFASSVLLTAIVMAAVPIIADSLAKARAAHARLMREGEVMRAGLALQAAAGEMRMRPGPQRIMAERRPALAAARRRPAPRACAAA